MPIEPAQGFSQEAGKVIFALCQSRCGFCIFSLQALLACIFSFPLYIGIFCDQQSRELSQNNVSRRAKKLKVKEEEIKLKPVIAFDCGGLFLCDYSFSSNFAEEMKLKLMYINVESELQWGIQP
ncbi:hypothetical protein AHAS_Ahas19G0210800 [Arachis hypogaea]